MGIAPRNQTDITSVLPQAEDSAHGSPPPAATDSAGKEGRLFLVKEAEWVHSGIKFEDGRLKVESGDRLLRVMRKNDDLLVMPYNNDLFIYGESTVVLSLRLVGLRSPRRVNDTRDQGPARAKVCFVVLSSPHQS